jgi:hypothetical protein
MNYNRPEVRVLGPAIVAIQSTTGSKETKPYPDAPLLATVSAYQADEVRRCRGVRRSNAPIHANSNVLT